MAQQRKLTRKEKTEISRQSITVLQHQKKKKPAGNHLKLFLGLIIAAVGFLLYIGTIRYSYTLDDYSTIKENYVVQKGISGISTIFKTSYRYGYWSSTDELYRPLSLALFAVEWNYFPDNPVVPHAVNILLYALTGFLLFYLLARLFKNQYLIPFIATLLFIAHPVHTEVIASIKSGDEILSFLFSIISIYWLLDYTENKSIIRLMLSSVAFFLALMSKEDALTFLAVIPLLLFVFKDFSVLRAIRTIIPLFVVTAIYMVIRGSVLHGIIHTKAIDMLDNILVTAPNYIDRFSTAIYVLGRYLLLLLLPLHLSIDYSLNQITILRLTDYRVLISLAIYAALSGYAIYKIRKKDTISFGILFYLVTISIVSNIFIIIGTVMADRLLYLPSLGFCLVIAVLIVKVFRINEGGEGKPRELADFLKRYGKAFAVVFILLILYSFKTKDRLPVWEDNNTLYSSGVIDSPNSSRTHYLMGIELKNIIAEQEKDSLKRIAIYKNSIDEFKKAIEIYPESFDSYRDMGRSYDMVGDTTNALISYDMALKLNPHDVKAMNNKSTVLFRRGNYGGAMDLLKEAVQLDPRYADALKNLGSCYGITGDYEDALVYFFKSLDFENNKDALQGTYRMIGMTYSYMGNKTEAEEYLAKASEIAVQ